MKRKSEGKLLGCFFFIVHWRGSAHMFLLQALADGVTELGRVSVLQ